MWTAGCTVSRIDEKAHGKTGVVIHSQHGDIGNINDGRTGSGVRTLPEKHSAQIMSFRNGDHPGVERCWKEDRAFLKKFDRFEPACSGVFIDRGSNAVPATRHHNFFLLR